MTPSVRVGSSLSVQYALELRGSLVTTWTPALSMAMVGARSGGGGSPQEATTASANKVPGAIERRARTPREFDPLNVQAVVGIMLMALILSAGMRA